MTEPPPRKRFQIHLSTAILMMFVAGGFIWLNTRAQLDTATGQRKDLGLEADFVFRSFGWPCVVVVDSDWVLFRTYKLGHPVDRTRPGEISHRRELTYHNAILD